MRKRLLATILIASIGTASAQEPAATVPDEALTAFINRALDDFVTPGFAQLAAAAEQLDASVGAFCSAPTEPAFAAVGTALEAAVTAWARVIALPIEPLLVDSRRERVFFWPDPRGVTLRQIQPVILDQDATVTDPTELGAKSVALQGLGALEYVLFGAGSESMLTGNEDGAFRCGYATALSANLSDVATTLAEETAPHSAFADAVRNPGPDNPLYLSPNAVMSDLIIGVGTAIEYARDSLLLPVLGETIEFARPRVAPLWRSGLALTFFHSLVDGARMLLESGGLADVLPDDFDWIVDSLAWEFMSIETVLPDSEIPIELAATDEAFRQALLSAAAYTDNLKSLIRTYIPNGLGLTGFNFADGD